MADIEMVSESSAKIRALSGRGEELGKVVNVIDAIAEQTNLLALNAALSKRRVPASRVGVSLSLQTK